MTQTALILGATGRFGRNAAEAFWNAGWRVHLFDRKTDDLMTAARGVDVIVNGWNPAYTEWSAHLPGLTAQVIAAARASGATVILPGNVYVYGKDAPEAVGPDTPHAAQDLLGRLRVEMEASYRASGIRCIILRAGDFLDTEASGNWFDKMMAPPLKKGVLRYPGDLDAPHAWAFLPDLARAAVSLAEKRVSLPRFADIPFAGYTLTGREMAALAERALGRRVRAARMSWLPLHLARPFRGMAKHLLSMRYLWSKPHHLEATPFDALVPEFRATDPAEAMRQAIAPVLWAEPDQPKPTGVARPPVPAE
jgi:nucleoside-diphosphate-sugar epimerase